MCQWDPRGNRRRGLVGRGPLALQGFIDHHGVLAGFVLVLIEETGVPVPVPGDFLMLALGVHARQGQVSLPASSAGARDRNGAWRQPAVRDFRAWRAGVSSTGTVATFT